jgi:hypothetical protein
LEERSGELSRPPASAFKQPISRAKIDLLFDADKRGLVVKLRDLNLAEEFAWGPDGHLRFTTASLSGSQAATQPFDNREATSFRLGRAIGLFLTPSAICAFVIIQLPL